MSYPYCIYHNIHYAKLEIAGSVDAVRLIAATDLSGGIVRISACWLALVLLGGCASQIPVNQPQSVPISRGVHSGERTKIGDYYSIDPNCESQGYPEITVVKAPSHGTASSAPGEDYPDFDKDNVRHECNRKLLPSTQVIYQSSANFRGTDTFTIEVRFPGSGLRTSVYVVTVR